MLVLFLSAVAAPPSPPLRAAIREEDPLGGPTLVIAPEVRCSAGEFAFVKAVTEGKVIRWRAVDPGLSVIPAELLRDTKTAVVFALRPGRYRLHAVTAAGDVPSEIVETLIVVGDGPAPPPGPDPPVPPPPVPPPTPPDDPLTAELRRAYRSDLSADPKAAEHARTLSGFYSAMAVHVESGKAATVGDLLSDYREAIPEVLPAGAVPSLRKVCGGETAEALGLEPDKRLDADLKAKAAGKFKALANGLLEVVK